MILRLVSASEEACPSLADLEAITIEMPLIEAEIDLVDAEIRVLTAEPHPSDLDWRRLRRAENRVGQEMKEFHVHMARLMREDACLQAA